MEINKIYLGDCLHIMQGMADNSVDAVITSPPYADRRKSTYGGLSDNLYNEWFIEIAAEIKRVLKNTGSFFLNIKPHSVEGERSLYVFKLIILLKEQTGFKFVDEFCWTKSGVPGRLKGKFKNAFEPVYHFTKTDSFTFNPLSVATAPKEESIKRYSRKTSGPAINGSGFAGMRKKIIENNFALPSNHLHIPQKSNQFTIEKAHPAVFPVDLPSFFIRAFTNESDIILDPFSGSGTTAIACIRNNRQFIGIDKEAEYVELAVKRIKNELYDGL